MSRPIQHLYKDVQQSISSVSIFIVLPCFSLHCAGPRLHSPRSFFLAHLSCFTYCLILFLPSSFLFSLAVLLPFHPPLISLFFFVLVTFSFLNLFLFCSLSLSLITFTSSSAHPSTSQANFIYYLSEGVQVWPPS